MSSDTVIFLPEEKIFAVFVVIVLGLLLCVSSFVLGANYAIQKHEDTYCPDSSPAQRRFGTVTPSGAYVPSGCKNGEDWDN